MSVRRWTRTGMGWMFRQLCRWEVRVRLGRLPMTRRHLRRCLSIHIYIYMLRWSRGSVLAFSAQVCGFKPGRSRRNFRAKKILRTPFFGGEVKPSVPCRRFATCKRSLNLCGSRNLGKITTGHLSRPQFHLSMLGSLASMRTEAPGG